MPALDEDLQKKIKEFGAKPAGYSLNDKSFDAKGYETAILRATRDLTARTLTPQIPKPEDPVKGTLIATLLDKENENSFLKKIEQYFCDAPRSDKDFDRWHDERCQEILRILRCFYKNQNGTDVCYGKAQKIVNMTLKGCYCLQGATQRDAYFQHCHMALDRFTLAWYNRTLKAANKKTDMTVSTPWSNLDETEYKAIQYAIRDLRMDMPPFDDLTALQKEFLIWPVEIMIDTVKAVNTCFGGMLDDDYAVGYFEKYGMTNDLKMANIILGKAELNPSDDDFIHWLKDKIPNNQPGKQEAAKFILEKNDLI